MAKRRAHGEGTVSKRKDGTWEGKISWWDGTRRSVYASTQSEVLKKMAKARSENELRLNSDGSKTKVATFLSEWLEEVIKPQKADATYSNYRVYINNHIIPVLGRHTLAELTTQRIQRWLSGLTEKGLSATTVGNARAVLAVALKRAVDTDYLTKNPTKLAHPPRRTRYEHRVLTISECGKFLNAVRGHRLETLYVVALGLGLRQGEVLGLQWKDIDFDRCELRVSQSLHRTGSKLKLGAPKTRGSNRTLSLGEQLIDALREHHQRQRIEQLKNGLVWQDHGLVFPSDVGTPMHARNLLRHFYKVRDGIGLSDLRFHDLRHTFATLLISDNSTHLRVLQDALGHSRMSTTYDTYVTVMPTQVKDLGAKMDVLLKKWAN